MSELIKVKPEEINSQQIETVNARDLHSFLKSKQQFADWIKKRIKQYGFVEDEDYVCFHKKMKANNATLTEFHLTLDMAKEISMVERNAKGKEARRYFIECEKTSKQSQQSVPGNFSDALLLAAEQAKQLELVAPKVALAEAIGSTENAIKIGDYVKAISKATGFIIGRNNFYKWLKSANILQANNLPYQRYIDNSWLEVKESTYENKGTNGPRVGFTTLITGRGQVSILNKFKESADYQVFLNKNTSASKSKSEVTV